MAPRPTRRRKGVWFGPTAPHRAAQHCPPPGKAPAQGFQDKPWRTHADPGLAGSSDTHSGWRKAQAAGCARGRCVARRSAPAAGAAGRADVSPGEHGAVTGTAPVSSTLSSLSLRWGLLHRNLNHTAQQAPFFLLGTIGNAAPPRKAVTTTNQFLGSVSSRQPHCSPRVRSHH